MCVCVCVCACVRAGTVSLSNQKQLIESSKKLENQLDSAREEVSNAFSSIQQQAWSFKEQFNEVNTRVNITVWHL